MDYAALKLTADGLIATFKQGTFEAGATLSTPGATPLDAPSLSTEYTEFNASAFRGVSSQYLNDTSLLASDLQAITQADAPVIVGQIVKLDNSEYTVVRIDRIPANGIAVAKRIFVRA